MKKTAAPIEAPYAEGSDSADAPAITKAIAERIHEVLLDIDPGWVRAVGGDAGKLLIVQSTGDPAFKALTGDVTISESGVTAIGNEKVKTAMLAALAVTEAVLGGESVATAKIKALAVTAAKLAADAVETAKIKNLAVTEGKLAALAVATGKLADGAATSRKVNLTKGLVKQEGSLALTSDWKDVPSAILEITPEVESKLSVWAVFNLLNESNSPTCNFFGVIDLDGVDSHQAHIQPAIAAAEENESVHSAPLNTVLDLSAAKHVIKLQAKRQLGSGDGTLNGSHFIYELTAAV